MSCKSQSFRVSRIHGAIALCMAVNSSTWAQESPTEITITAEPLRQVSGFDGVPLHKLPLNVSVIGNATLRDMGAQRVSEALLLDASVSDSYNLPAYWDKLSVRGFALDNRYNYRREGLPISAETIIPMDNKERIELFKGTSGIQAGTSAPGGLVNYVVKRAPTSTEKNIRDVMLSFGPGDNRLIAADLGGRFGEGADFGYRFNVAHEDLNPYIHDSKGYRDLAALAMDWRINGSNRLEWEFEQSHHEQIGVNFYSLLGPGTNALPAPVDGTRNITRQPNSQPGVFDGFTGSIQLKHQLESGWLWTTQYGAQRLRADDRLVYASGCATSPTNRFCANGDFQIFDYRDENEHRNSEVMKTEVSGQTQLGGLEHSLTLSAMRYRQINLMPYKGSVKLVGTTNIDGGLTLPTTPQNLSGLNTNNSNYTTELAIKDRLSLTAQTTAWLGLRYTMLNRSSARTDGSNAETDQRGMATPWLALSQQLDTHHIAYVSYGQGLESEVAPNNRSYSNAGQALKALRSTQREVGIKGEHNTFYWQANWFDITRPISGDVGACNDTANSCTRQIDGEAHHQGLELNANQTFARWTLGGAATWIDAQRENATIDPSVNGQRPINVPKYILRGMVEYRYSTVVGLRSGLRISHEAERNVTENGDIMLPAWTTLDATTHYDTKIDNTASTWTLAINNLTDKRYWRESPKQYGQYFLYPGAPRTVRAAVQFHL
jgi:iron complex outermembrane recepter protein